MKEVRIRLHALIRGGLIGVAVLAAACARDRHDPPEVSPAERAAFTARADSSLTPDQVERYLRTMLAQFELVAAEAPEMRRQLEAARTQPARPGSPRTSRMKRWSDFLRATYVRGARRADANPAEMEYVGDRMRLVSGYLSARQAQASGGQMAAMLRQQAELLRGQPGVSRDQVDRMLRSADEAEQQVVQPPPPRLQQNLAVLRRARGNVTDAMWIRIASVSGGVGLMALGDMGDTTSTGALARLDELRALYASALDNRGEPAAGGGGPQ